MKDNEKITNNNINNYSAKELIEKEIDFRIEDGRFVLVSVEERMLLDDLLRDDMELDYEDYYEEVYS